MGQSSPQFVYTMVTGADLSAHRNKFAKVSADYTAALATAVGDAIIGVIDDIPYNAAGAQVAIRFGGTAQVVAGAAFAAGARLTTDASGRAITATVGQRYYAIALEAATAVGDMPEVFLQTGTA
jgi:hypothetical protein